MAAKVTKVKVVCPPHGLTDEFEIKHAERLLRMPNNGGWRLPDDSEYKFDFDNGIGRKRNKKTDNGAEKEGDDK